MMLIETFIQILRHLNCQLLAKILLLNKSRHKLKIEALIEANQRYGNSRKVMLAQKKASDMGEVLSLSRFHPAFLLPMLRIHH